MYCQGARTKDWAEANCTLRPNSPTLQYQFRTGYVSVRLASVLSAYRDHEPPRFAALRRIDANPLAGDPPDINHVVTRRDFFTFFHSCSPPCRRTVSVGSVATYAARWKPKASAGKRWLLNLESRLAYLPEYVRHMLRIYFPAMRRQIQIIGASATASGRLCARWRNASRPISSPLWPCRLSMLRGAIARQQPGSWYQVVQAALEGLVQSLPGRFGRRAHSYREDDVFLLG
jgi:hypothetical protein